MKTASLTESVLSLFYTYLYKKGILKRQSFSEVEMGRGSPVCKNFNLQILEQFQNNVAHCKIVKSQKIPFKDSGNLEKSLCIRYKIKKLILHACDLLAPSSSALKTHNRNTSGNQSSLCQLQIQVKDICEDDPSFSESKHI